MKTHRTAFADEDRTGCQGNALSDTDDTSTDQERCQFALRTESLNKRSNDDKDAPAGHADTTAEVIGNGASEEEASDDSSDGVSCVDTT